MGIRYIFTGKIHEDRGDVNAVFIKTVSWGPIRKFLDARGIRPAQRVYESEKDCVLMVEAILHRNPTHGHVDDLDGYRDAWQMIRRKKTQLGLSLDTDSIE